MLFSVVEPKTILFLRRKISNKIQKQPKVFHYFKNVTSGKFIAKSHQ